MDPQACLTRLLTAYLDNDTGEWEDARKTYNKWREQGGYAAWMYSNLHVDEVQDFGMLLLLPEGLGAVAKVVRIAPARYGEDEQKSKNRKKKGEQTSAE